MASLMLCLCIRTGLFNISRVNQIWSGAIISQDRAAGSGAFADDPQRSCLPSSGLNGYFRSTGTELDILV